jgi:LacI family transcriptional regulator
MPKAMPQLIVKAKSKPRPTMRKIAACAGVSPTTVAHVLNHTRGTYVSQPTRSRVLEAAEKLGYQEALLSQSIKRPLRHLGMVVSDTDHAQVRADAMEIFEGVRQEAATRDYITVLLPMAPEANSNYNADEAVKTVCQLHRTKLIDGFIVDKSCFLSEPVRTLDARGIPLAIVNGTPTFHHRTIKPILSAVIDNRTGGRLATEHLIALGHRRIAVLTRPWASYPEGFRPYQVSQIIRGYHDALGAAGLPLDPSLILDAHTWDKSKTYACVDQLLQLSAPPTAFLASDDAIAMMVIHGLNKRALRVPGDISVIGYGGWSQAAWLCEPDLTTIHADLRSTGVLAASLLIQRLAGRHDLPMHTLIQPRLKPGGSTGPCDRR